VEIAFETIYFGHPIEKALQEVYRTLKHGGRFMIFCEVNDP